MRRATIVVLVAVVLAAAALTTMVSAADSDGSSLPAVDLQGGDSIEVHCANALGIEIIDKHSVNDVCSNNPTTTTTEPGSTTTEAPTTTQAPTTTTEPPTTTLPPTTLPPPPPTTLPPANLVNVRLAPYNAACNGSTDDTTPIQAAATAAAGKTLYFPVGTCRVHSVNLPANVNVLGTGTGSVIKQTTLTTFNDPSPVFDALSNTTFRSLKIDGNRVANRPDNWSDAYNNAGKGFKNSTCCGRGRGYRSGIRFESADGLIVDHVELTNMAGAAVAANMSSNITVQDSNIHDTDFEALYAFGDGAPVANVSGTNVNFVNNTMDNIKAPSAAGSTQPNGLVISRSLGGTISGNTATNTDRDFIKLEACQNYNVFSNTASAGSTSVNYPNVALQPYFNRHDLGSRHIHIYNNKLSGPGHQGGVQINSSNTTAKAAEDVEVDHNDLGGQLVYGVLMDGTVGLYGINIHDNKITGTSTAAIYVNGGGTGLSMNANTHNDNPMPNVNIPGTFSQSKYYN